MKEMPKVGVGVIILKNNKVLLGKRKNSHGEGTWQFPGGHLEFNEEFEDCAKREVFEETNLKIKDISFVTVTNDFFEKENKHYITVFMKSNNIKGDLKLMEPHKCKCWEWFDWEDLPSPLMTPIENFLKLKNC